MQSITPEVANHMSRCNANIWHGTVNAAEKSVLVTPPGAMVFINPINDVNVGGVRIPFLSFGPQAQTEFGLYTSTRAHDLGKKAFLDGVKNLMLHGTAKGLLK